MGCVSGSFEELSRARPRVDWGLYVITDSRLCRGRSLDECVEAALRGGATVIQLREKEAPTRHLVELGRRLRAVTRRFGATFIVNDRVDVALATEADGVHLGTEDMGVADARRLLGDGRLIGASVESPAEALAAEAAGADYLGVGPIYATSSKPDAGPPRGPGLVRAIRACTRLPIVAISGITADNAPEVIRAGADGVAVIAAVMGAADVEQAARRLADAVRRARGGGPSAGPDRGPGGEAREG